MRRIWVVLLALALAGCAKISLTTQCPTTSNGVSFALAGSTVGNQAIAMLGSALGAAGVMAKRSDAGPTTTNTMTYSYIPIFGADSGSLTCIVPVGTPGVLVPGPPPQILH